MDVRPWLPTDEAKAALEPSITGATWQDVKGWIDARTACVWRIGEHAWGLTLANADGEIELLAGGGVGAWRAVPAFEKAMIALPEHKGMTLRIEGRKGWARLLPNWSREEQADGTMVLKLKV